MNEDPIKNNDDWLLWKSHPDDCQCKLCLDMKAYYSKPNLKIKVVTNKDVYEGTALVVSPEPFTTNKDGKIIINEKKIVQLVF